MIWTVYIVFLQKGGLKKQLQKYFLNLIAIQSQITQITPGYKNANERLFWRLLDIKLQVMNIIYMKRYVVFSILFHCLFSALSNTHLLPPLSYSTHLKALYSGRYQHTKEQGVKRTNHKMERPNVVPPSPSTMKYARLAQIFRNRTTTWAAKWQQAKWDPVERSE